MTQRNQKTPRTPVGSPARKEKERDKQQQQEGKQRQKNKADHMETETTGNNTEEDGKD